ncbi:DUF2267 domain-containing protein [Pseudonocardia bannensis]|uniref:DUF2267 domain-containing protein n=1 Tax=Pseudonocardia bannensis TaxID=630973 RepID=A0A848DRS3_9PSEU|nr:DUF2267 domain-containing protein [Pseudonocardia bannensis]NMH95225.1 DUF2267 domain-containing protein [Pseudonocardia bannensis]
MDEREFYRTAAQRAGLSREEAADLSWATLQVLAARMSDGEARDLARALPDGLAEPVRAGRTRRQKRYGLIEVEQQVSERIGLTQQEVHEGIRAVLTTLRDIVPDQVFTEAMGQLPGEFRTLVEETA